MKDKTEKKNLSETLCAIALEQCSGLEVKIGEGLTEDIGILRHEEAEYVWGLKWTKQDNKVSFLMEVHQVIRPKNKRHKCKLKLAASREFNHQLEEK